MTSDFIVLSRRSGVRVRQRLLLRGIRSPIAWTSTFVILMLMALSGCQQKDEIVTYKVPKKIPEQLLPEKQRMLAAMVPRDGKVWFFKVLGPKSAVDLVADPFRDFVTGIQFDSQGEPELGDLPDGWRRGGEKAMRHATIDINTPKKQLDLSISFLPSPGSTEGEVWDTYVDQNINRWRGQVGLKPSTDKWAGGTEIKIDAAEGVGVWFDQSGDPSDVAATSMGTPPMMAGGMGPMNPGPLNPGTGAAPANPETQAPARPKIEFNSPDGWQEIQASGMREVAFKLGSDEQAAEVTIITAGGDLRSNVARWMGQVAGQQPADAAVDEMMASVQKFQVSGREAQRFIIAGDAESGKMSIDATIVDLGGGFSKFIKMTGNPKTVAEQTESMRTFLESLSF